MDKSTLCLNCSYQFEGNECPLCCWKPNGSEDTKNEQMRITLVFEEGSQSSFDELLKIATSAHHFSSKEESEGVRYFATFLPHQASDLFALFRKITSEHRLQILLNGKIRPYTHTLWLPLLWFLEGKQESEGVGEKHGH